VISLFRAARNATVNISVSSSSQRVLVANSTGPQQIRVMNNGTATVWIAFGDVTITTTTTSGMPVGPGQVCGFTACSPNGGDLYAAAIAGGSTGSIYFTPGTGI
jgi:hypothetical protein